MLAQAVDLTKAAVAVGDTALATGAANLQHVLNECANSGHMNRPKIEQACLALWPYLPANATEKAA